jgi:hypothetical protein
MNIYRKRVWVHRVYANFTSYSKFFVRPAAIIACWTQVVIIFLYTATTFLLRKLLWQILDSKCY